MSWYNPRSWIREFQKPTKNPNKLYCDNSQCEKPIKEDTVAYNRESREVTHPDECQTALSAIKCFQMNKPTFSTWEGISLEDAISLLKEGKLKQSKRLENIE